MRVARPKNAALTIKTFPVVIPAAAIHACLLLSMALDKMKNVSAPGEIAEAIKALANSR
jgi:hypothetical protein